MTIRLLAAWPLERYQLWLAYADGTEGAVDLEDLLVPASLEPLRDPREFRQFKVDKQLNLLVWPTGMTLDATTLHREIRQRQRRKRIGFL